MKRLIISLAFILSCFPFLLKAAADSCLIAGIAADQNYEFDKAREIFMQAPLREPVRAFYIMNAQYKKLKINGHYKDANTYLIEGVNKNKALFEESLNPDDPDYAELLMYYGALLGLQAQVFMAESKYLQGYYSGLTGLKKVETAYNMNPDLTDALLAMGTSAFYTGIMAQHYSIIGSVINAEESIRKGIDYIQKTWDSRALSQAEAGYLLLLINLYEIQDFETASGMGGILLEKFPGNLENRALYAETLILRGDFEQAEEILHDFLDYTHWLDDNGKNMWSLRKTYVEAVLAMEKNDFDTAKIKFNHVLENYCFEYQWQKNLSLLKLGQMADLQGDRKKARMYYQHVINSKETTRSVLDAGVYIKKAYKKSS
jgi:hypothetical protein